MTISLFLFPCRRHAIGTSTIDHTNTYEVSYHEKFDDTSVYRELGFVCSLQAFSCPGIFKMTKSAARPLI